ncbi:MAG: CAP domain-containing protein [Phyllobacterium sp.]|uniref:CAP domain-containing protein n=1 Tax=Phyllobacterium sp. TaxID=1871046 RepID=UPI0030F2AA24
MSETKSLVPRRNFLVLAAGAALLPLAGCQSAAPLARLPGKSAGVSASGSANLAAIRSSKGLGPLSPSSALERAALQQAGYMASSGRMSHSTSWNRGFASRIRGAGIHGPAAENIARGQWDMNQVFAQWMASPPHRRNMLDPQFSHFGLAYAESGTQRYWVLVLGV